MTELFRDTAFGHLVRLVSRGKFFKFEEEKDPSLWKKFVNEEKSGLFAHHGHAGPHGDDSDTEDRPATTLGGVRTRDERQRLEKLEALDDHSGSSSQTRVPEKEDGPGYNEPSGVKIDPEKGRDLFIVDWWGPNDTEVSLVASIRLHSRRGLREPSIFSQHYNIPWRLRCRLISTLLMLGKLAESPELVSFQKVLRYIPNLSPHVRHLHWLSYILCWRTGYRKGLWCQ